MTSQLKNWQKSRKCCNSENNDNIKLALSGIMAYELMFLSLSYELIFPFEINLRKKKWALFSVYRPPTQSQDNLFENLGRALDHYSENYENFMFMSIAIINRSRIHLNREGTRLLANNFLYALGY